MALRLSHWRMAGRAWGRLSNVNRRFGQMTSWLAFVLAQYCALVEERVTVCCSLLLQLMALPMMVNK